MLVYELSEITEVYLNVISMRCIKDNKY